MISFKLSSVESTINDPDHIFRTAHLLCGSGGCRAVLAGVGTFLAFDMAGVNFNTIGGVSGGAIPAFLLASGKDLDSIVRLAVNMKFSKLVTKKTDWPNVGEVICGRFASYRPRYSMYGSTNLGSFIEKINSRWPSKFWTTAVTDDSIIAFVPQGSYIQHISGARNWKMLSNALPGTGLAIRATVAIPGLIEAVPSPFNDGEFLYDGAIGPEGSCPISIPRSILKAEGTLFVIDVGEDHSSEAKQLDLLLRVLLGSKCFAPQATPLIEDSNIVFVRPRETQLSSFEFSASRDRKWKAVLEGYYAAFQALCFLGILSGDPTEAAMLWLGRQKVLKSDLKRSLVKALKSFPL